MKLSTVRYGGHNMYRWIKRQWFAQSRKKIFNTPMKSILQRNNIPLYEAVDVAKEPPITWNYKVDTIGVGRPPPKLDEYHPLKKKEPCLSYRDHNVLVEGLNQAKCFSNTIQIEENLPKKILQRFEHTPIERFEERVQMALACAVVYDATQKKLPKRKDPENPAWNYPRDYGINDSRRNYILCNRFLQLCELMTNESVTKKRCKFHEAFFSVPLLRNEDLIQLQCKADLLILADQPIAPLISPQLNFDTVVPNLEPLKYTVSLEEEYFYELKNIYPISASTPYKYSHTALIHFNETEVKNLHGSPVLEDQTTSRSLMKLFAIAAAQARFLYGETVTKLPEPIVVQGIQTDAKYFHFSIFQLNTLSWPPVNNGERNIFWHHKMIPAYDYAGFYEGRPTISAYNSDIFKMFLTFYRNK